jgi:hypothetical protein
MGSLSRRRRLAGWATVLLGVSAAWPAAPPAPWVSDQARPGDFALVSGGRAAEVIYAAEDFKVVAIAANDLAADVERVTGKKPAVRTDDTVLSEYVVLAGTLGQSPAIDALAASGKLDVSAVRGQWETFLTATVPAPLPGVKLGLVIAGSDRRGTAYGLYELSQAIGVSPWYWWADVAPARRAELYVAAGTRRSGPPSVQYRGLFINDEDWGLQPWAAKTFAPEEGAIGPKVYAKVFELLLRLKANTLWPAMHKCTRAFNSFPRNARLADDYAIVMGSSHAEPMLRNNVGEWTAPPEDYDYLKNREGVRRYWEERVAANGRCENIYTLGMRGLHDSQMVGPKTDAERIRTLEQIFADQRALLAKHVRPDVERVPQMFCAYKEVLDLYRQGLKVPDDVTIVWPDDNFGYIRTFASPEERRRSGGCGVYYHVSYLGRPLSYLWLGTTPPALIWEEMSKAYDYGARKLWIVNVGDIKPAEIDTEFFLQMAWDINRWRRDNLPDFLPEWAAREFGADHAKEIAAIMADYYRLNYQRKPEHLQWWLPNENPRRSPFAWAEAESRARAFAELRGRVQRSPLGSGETSDAFFELVAYPVSASALANERFFFGERAAGEESTRSPEYLRFAEGAAWADRELVDWTRSYGQRAGGKWAGFLWLEPADDDWRSMRIAPWVQPKYARPEPAPPATPAASGSMAPPGFVGFAEREGVVSIQAEHFSAKVDRGGGRWEVIPGLGRTGDAMAVFPTTTPSIEVAHAATDAPRLDYSIWLGTTGEFGLHVSLLPTHPLVAGRGLRLAVALDDAPPQLVALDVKDGGKEWAQGVLNNTVIAKAKLKVVAPGRHTLRIYGLDAGVLIEKVVIDTGPSTGSGQDGRKPSYLGPPETRVLSN